ncbi:hypothetical protein EAF04_001948 [Stromatinia cepivora]|nr:hypothetical protein EAF04_001948 [Stromatinia cepivora]
MHHLTTAKHSIFSSTYTNAHTIFSFFPLLTSPPYLTLLIPNSHDLKIRMATFMREEHGETK